MALPKSINRLVCWVLLGILAVLIAIPVYFWGSVIVAALTVVHEADSGFKKAKKTIDPEQLRVWAFAMVKAHNGTNGCDPHVKKSEMPDYVLNLYSTPPEMAWVSPQATDKDPLIRIIWGGGFFGWALIVGTTNFSMSPFGDGHAVKWASGIYYTREGK